MSHSASSQAASEKRLPWLMTTEKSVLTPVLRTSGRASVARACAAPGALGALWLAQPLAGPPAVPFWSPSCQGQCSHGWAG